MRRVLRDGDKVADATEGVIVAIAAAGGNDEVVFAAWDWIAKDDFGGDDVAFKDFRLLDDLCLVETATIALFQPKALVRFGAVNHNVVSRNADGVVRDDFIRGLRIEIEGVVNTDEPLGKSINRLDPLTHRLTVTVPRLDRTLRVHAVGFRVDIPCCQGGGKSRIERGGGEMKAK